MSLSFAELSRRLNVGLAAVHSEWSGVPITLPGLSLVVEDRNPWRDAIAKCQAVVDADAAPALADLGVGPAPDADDDADTAAWRVVNSWWSSRLRRPVAIAVNDATPPQYRAVVLGKYDYVRRFAFTVDTLRASAAWTIETETAAMERLATLVKVHLFEAYIATGVLLETSHRSGLGYFFRRCRPTVVYNARTQRVIAALCLHPVAYYADTHAGGMCPTDDVIAHLMLMRGDEHLLWRRANQHPPDRPEAAL